MNILEYLQQLTDRAVGLKGVVPKLEIYLVLAGRLGRLSELIDGTRSALSTCAIDPESTLGIRPTRVWAIVGARGIPDDVEVVSEWMSLFPSKLCVPDLDPYLEQGKKVLPGKTFIDLATRLWHEASTGSTDLPYRLENTDP